MSARPPRAKAALGKRGTRPRVAAQLRRNLPQTPVARSPKVRGSEPKTTRERGGATGYRVPIDTGDYANSWRAVLVADGAIVYSATSPPAKAGVIEEGRRPAWIPIAPLAQWVRRKLGIKDEAKARGVAYAISRAASRTARPGLHVLRRATPRILEALRQNVERELARI